MKRYTIKIFGKVQGVGFRFRAQEKAKELSLFGYAKNMEDGSVLIDVEGEVEQLNIFFKWCEGGSESVAVSKLSYAVSDELKNYSAFVIF